MCGRPSARALLGTTPRHLPLRFPPGRSPKLRDDSPGFAVPMPDRRPCLLRAARCGRPHVPDALSAHSARSPRSPQRLNLTFRGAPHLAPFHSVPVMERPRNAHPHILHAAGPDRPAPQILVVAFEVHRQGPSAPIPMADAPPVDRRPKVTRRRPAKIADCHLPDAERARILARQRDGAHRSGHRGPRATGPSEPGQPCLRRPRPPYGARATNRSKGPSDAVVVPHRSSSIALLHAHRPDVARTTPPYRACAFFADD